MQLNNISKLFLMRKVQLLIMEKHISFLYILFMVTYVFLGIYITIKRKKKHKEIPSCIIWTWVCTLKMAAKILFKINQKMLNFQSFFPRAGLNSSVCSKNRSLCFEDKKILENSIQEKNHVAQNLLKHESCVVGLRIWTAVHVFKTI